jgi:hypothetical protein
MRATEVSARKVRVMGRRGARQPREPATPEVPRLSLEDAF